MLKSKIKIKNSKKFQFIGSVILAFEFLLFSTQHN